MTHGFQPPHRVWRVGADVDTDQLAPGGVMSFGIEVIAQHCLRGLRPELAGSVQPGDVLVAGPNFGIGSSREQAAAALVHLGVAAVIAPSFSGLFFRNAFNLGLLLMTCPQADRLAEGATVSLDPRAGRVICTDGTALTCEPIAGFLLDLVQAGGLLPKLRQRLSTERPHE